MREMDTFVRDDVLPSWWANAIQRFISTLAVRFRVTRASDTSVAVVASANDGAVTIAIEGKWRWIEATVSRAHPGGAAGAYPLFVTAADNDIVNLPDPGTDNTPYAFALAITAPGNTPPIVAGVVDIFREVGTVLWDGAQIVGIRQSVGDQLDGRAQASDLKLSYQAEDHAGWTLADGRNNIPRSIVSTEYRDIALARGWNGTDGTHIGVPNLADRFGLGTGSRAIGVQGGEETHDLTVAELPPHDHPIIGETDSTHPHEPGSNADRLMSGWGGNPRNVTGTSTEDVGGGDAHNNMPPFFTANWFIFTGAGF